VDFRVIRY